MYHIFNLASVGFFGLALWAWATGDEIDVIAAISAAIYNILAAIFHKLLEMQP